ncbi:MAG: UDP-N-acetylglucosamine--N-acetylmuramyl-(pentapeptide) pyrophosphoryl-undecaprenol N-acetylglucosamine transferase [Patescibacteria group bacterium]|nr:UDP-N-acetylglucosamine--N-acetylmuramyl-(pentapeptide) pyrophosphoryl-undecaprenol N-acetylglucosamine transferase [Patescibacteria group bacterium]
MKILFTGGGTGGHVFPIIAIVREIRKLSSKENLEFFYSGPKDDFGKILLSQENIEIKHILAGKIRRYIDAKSFLQNLVDILFKMPIGFLQAFFHIFFLAPDLIFSKGGFGSIPTVIASWLLGTPIFLHESDATPGIANRILSKFSLEIFISFRKTPYFPEGKMISTGNPIRRELLEGSKEKAKILFKISGEKPVILILGGSQGAQRINDKILEILPKILEEFELIHQSGENNFSQVKAEAKVIITKISEKYYHPFPFLKEGELKRAYAICDLVVSRAGSGTIFEIAALGKPSILIPLPESAQNHQLKNAYTYAKNGSAIVLEEENFTPHFFLEKLKNLFSHPEKLDKMGKLAKEFSKPLAARTIAGYVSDYLSPQEQRFEKPSESENLQKKTVD